jgi:hypothetical protein
MYNFLLLAKLLFYREFKNSSVKLPYLHYIGNPYLSNNSVAKLISKFTEITIDDAYAINFWKIKQLLTAGVSVHLFACGNVTTGEILRKDKILIAFMQARYIDLVKVGNYRFFVPPLSLKYRIRLGRLVNRYLMNVNCNVSPELKTNMYFEYFEPMSKQQLVELKSEGCIIGWHTSKHDLIESVEQILDEWDERRPCEEYLGFSFKGFALPYGAPFYFELDQMHRINTKINGDVYFVEEDLYNLASSTGLTFRQNVDFL